MTPYTLARATHEVRMDVPAGAVDIPGWLFSFSDTEYQDCAKGHFGAGASTLPDGRRTSVNVESVGGHLAVQHYLEERSEPNHLRLVSERTDAWIFHLFHFRPRVTWEMTVVPSSAEACVFRCTVAVEHPSVLIKIASALTLFQHFVQRHDDEEARLFAASLARRTRREPSPPGAAAPRA